MMQLACIVNMVPKWCKLTLRVCVCDEARQTSFSLSTSQQPHSERLRTLLKSLRISAQLFPVNGWSQVIEAHGSDLDNYLVRLVLNLCSLANELVTVLLLQSEWAHFTTDRWYCSYFCLPTSATCGCNCVGELSEQIGGYFKQFTADSFRPWC